MPDDATATVAEQDSAFEAGFGDEAAAAEGAKAADEAGKAVAVNEEGAGEKAPAKVEKTAEEGASKPGEKVEDKKAAPADKGKADEKAEDTAASRLEARAKEAAGQKDEPGEGTKPEEKPAAREEKKPAAAAPVIADLTDADLEGIKIKVGEGEQTLKEFGEGFPEVLAAADAIARLRMEKAGVVTRDDLVGLQVQMANANFWSNVVTGVHDKDGKFVEGHPDARKIVGTAEFGKWLGSQSKVVQALASSLDPMDGIAVVAAYKEHAGAAARAEKADKSRERTDKRVALHSDTVRPAKSSGDESGAGKESKDDFDAGFDAEG